LAKGLSGQVFVLPDGRKLGYTTVGKGAPVFYFHGTSSSRLEVLLLKELAQSALLQLVCVDRPGYGRSTYRHRNNLADFNDDLAALADHLKFESFRVLGWSGGGAFALAYTMLNPKRVNSAVIAGTPNLPFDAATAHNMPFARYIMKIPWAGNFSMRQLSRQLLKANGNINAFLATPQGRHWLRGYTKRDLTFFSNQNWMELMYQAMVEAFRQGNEGVKAVVNEHRIFLKPWNLPFANVEQGKLWVWHGTEDLTCRVANAYAIAKAVPNAQLEVFEGAGHCVMFENLDRLSKILRTEC
jgi:pimeloyl-ACP methyl ester carboxylesterase